MAWIVRGNDLTMIKRDFGVALQVKINGVTLGAQDTIRFTINKGIDGETVCVKEYTGIIEDNTVSLEFSEEDTAKLDVGTYAYSLDWYQNGSFMDNIVPDAPFRVVKKVEANS